MVKVLSNQDYQNAARIVNHPSAVASGDLVIKQDLDNAVATLTGVNVQIPTNLDCSSNPNYPASQPGQSYYVTVAGKIGGTSGVDVNVGDTIICKNTSGSAGGDHATVGTDFFITEVNRDQATETVLGVVRLATQTEVNNGTNATAAVNPLALQTKLNNAFNSSRYSSAIGDGTNASFTITHSLNDPNVLVQIRETNAPFERVVADVAWTDANNVRVSFVNPPTVNQFTVSIR